MNNEIIQSYLTNIITVILSIFSTQYFYDSFFERKRLNRWLCASGYVLVSLAFFSSLQFIENRSLNMVILVSCTYLLSLFFTIKWYNQLLFSLLFIAISSICEIIIVQLLVNLFHIAVSDTREGIFLFVGMLLSKFTTFVCMALLRTRKYHFLAGKRLQGWIVLLILPISTLVVILIQYFFMWNFSPNSTMHTYTLISMCCLFICNLIVFRFIDTFWKTAETEQRLAVAEKLRLEQETQYHTLIHNHQEIAKIHHDYKNFLLGIQSQLIEQQYNEVIKKINSELSLTALSNSIMSGNPVVDTVVNDKMNTAKSNGVNIEFQFRNIQNLLIDSIDLSILLGNALDNAIEATCKVSDLTKKMITLLIVMKDNILNIVIKNPVEKPVDADHLVTDKKEKRFHGYGIINMRTIVNRYNGSLFFSCQDLSFGTTILLPNQKTSSPETNRSL